MLKSIGQRGAGEGAAEGGGYVVTMKQGVGGRGGEVAREGGCGNRVCHPNPNHNARTPVSPYPLVVMR